MNFIDAIMTIVGAILVIGLLTVMFTVPVGLYDVTTLEDIGTESVPCIDELNRPFEDEMCTKTITCSRLGWAGDKKCVNVLEGEA